MEIPGHDLGERMRTARHGAIHRGRRQRDGLPVLLRIIDTEYPGRLEQAALRHEVRMLERLQGVEGVATLLDVLHHGHGQMAVVLRDEGPTLAELLAAQGRQRLPPLRALDFASRLAAILAQVHERDLVYKAIEPASLLMGPGDCPILFDFGLASELTLERQTTETLTRRLKGTLPYLSPEQTGRMNRDLDYRSDFYSLGVLLFELLTGQLPFQADGVLEWVHCHIGKVPPSPSELDASIPAAVSAMVLKLLAKNAELRYQSSFGLISDLAHCRRQWFQPGSLPPFAPGRHDVPRRFQIPQKLYGREVQLADLLARYTEVEQGASVVCMVAGISGIGKSALVNELGKPLLRQRGHLIQGKFDQFKRSTPYSAMAVAMRALVQQMLSDAPAPLQARRERLRRAVGANAQVLIQLVPELERLLGKQAPVANLPPVEAQNRFQRVFVDLVRELCREQPLVVFLDDLQFADVSTLSLLRRLATATDLRGLMLIGAYRSNEVGAGHPLRLALDEIGASREVHTLALQPLQLESVCELVADALHADPVDCATLATRLHDQAEGNPFFLGELLRTLEHEHAIHFSAEQGCWRWDMAAVQRCNLSDNVVELVLGNLRRLDPATRQALQLAACIGNTFDLRTLAIIAEGSMDDTGAALLPALQRYMVIPLHDDYRLVGAAAGAGQDGSLNPNYRFQHDRVQQAAYALIDAELKAAVHLSVGELILHHASEAERDERLIDIVGHLNEGRHLIGEDTARRELARLNLEAGRRALRASAYESALGYLRIGQEMLPPDPWQQEPDLSFELACEAQQCAYLTGRHEEAEQDIERLLQHARSNLERAEVLSMRTRQYATTGRMADSIGAAIQGLNLLGIAVSHDPDPAMIGRERAAVRRHLGARAVADLLHAPPLRDPVRQVAIRLLMEIFPAAFLSGSGSLFPFLVLKSVGISMQGGNSPESAFAYAAYGMLLCGVLDDPRQGFEYGQLAVRMNEQFDDIALKSRVNYVYTMFIHHWSRHWSTMTPWFRKGIESGHQSGDLLYLAYSAQDCVIWDPRLDLEVAEREHADHLKVVRECAYQDSYDSGSLFLQMQRNFLGRTRGGLCSMDDADFDEQRCVAGMRERRFMTGIANYHIYKAEIAWLYGELDEALAHVREQDGLMASVMSLPQRVRCGIVAFLVLAAELPHQPPAGQAHTRERLARELRQMRRWARNCPDNFLHLQQLMEAELLRLDGRVDVAVRRYEAAMAQAHAQGWRRDEAMINELAGRHLQAAGRRKAAEGYIRAARHIYAQWGARRKVELLDNEFTAVLAMPRPLVPWMQAPPGMDLRSPAEVDSASLDLVSVMKASQAISGEIVLEQLWARTMQIMLENAGGQRGAFVVELADGSLVIEGLCEAGHDGASLRVTGLLDNEGEPLLPLSLIHQVRHSLKPLVLHDARRAVHVGRDPYMAQQRPQSVLCVPLLRQGRLEAVIYLENRLASGVFTDDRIEVIQLLAMQVSISIDNARLYESQSRLIQAQRRFVPSEFLVSLDHHDIARVDLGEHVAKTMSVMFADLRGFTPLAESLDPRIVIALLNRYFSSMEPPISAGGGFIDSFAGDEIKVLFEGAADGALRGGIGMWRALEELNHQLQRQGWPSLQMGVGLNTGPVVLGTVGARNRIQCSVIGDTVNLASRIEQLTKLYQARLLISDQTVRSLTAPSQFELRRVDRVIVKGKHAAVDLFEVIDADGPQRRAAKLATRALLETALTLYLAGEFDGACQQFEHMQRIDPLDMVPELFIQRCHRNVASPPPADWGGAERLASK
jgi:predicted ATPase/class 3 adenylate cyclase